MPVVIIQSSILSGYSSFGHCTISLYLQILLMQTHETNGATGSTNPCKGLWNRVLSKNPQYFLEIPVWIQVMF